MIIVLAVVTCVLLVLALRVNLPQTVKTKAPAIVVHAYTTLAVSKPVASKSAYLADINISTKSNKVTAVELQISYDPKAVLVEDIFPGNFFTYPETPVKKIDPSTGRITYALLVGLGKKPVSGNGVLATIKFLPVAGQKASMLNILLSTEVAAQGEVLSVLKSATGTILEIPTSK